MEWNIVFLFFVFKKRTRKEKQNFLKEIAKQKVLKGIETEGIKKQTFIERNRNTVKKRGGRKGEKQNILFYPLDLSFCQ